MAQTELRCRRINRVINTCSDWSPTSLTCFFCDRDTNDLRNGHVAAPFTQCQGRFHIECLVETIAGGRSECPCGNENFETENPIHMLVPASLPTSAFSDRDDITSSASSDGVTLPNDCSVCLERLSGSERSEGKVGKIPACGHEFHVKCLLDTAYIPVLNAEVYGNHPYFICPNCRREICEIQVPGAPPILVHYASLQRSESGDFFDFNGEQFQFRHRQGQNQESWSEMFWKGMVVVGVVVVGLFVMLRH